MRVTLSWGLVGKGVGCMGCAWVVGVSWLWVLVGVGCMGCGGAVMGAWRSWYALGRRYPSTGGLSQDKIVGIWTDAFEACPDIGGAP